MQNENKTITASSPVRLFLTVMVSTFMVEMLIMFILPFLPIADDWVHAVLDSLVLVILIFPVIYFFSYRPMAQHIAIRKQAEAELQKTLDELEVRIQERTEKLTRTNQKLQLEINERKRAEDALNRSESRLANILENAAEAIVVVDQNQKILLFNKGAEKIFGFQTGDVLGKPLDILLPERFIALHHLNVQALGASPPTSRSMGARQEVFGRRMDGTEFPAQVGISTHVESGQVIFTAILIDVTERKRAEEALSASEERYRSLFNRIPVALYRTSPPGQILDANPALVELLGYPDHEKLMSTNVNDIFLEPKDRVKENILLVRDGVVRAYQYQVRRYDGRPIWVRDTSRIIKDANGSVLYYEGSLENITEQLRAEEQLRFHTARTQALAKISHLIAEVGLDYQAILDVVTQRVSELIGDTCVTALISDDGQQLDPICLHPPQAEVLQTSVGNMVSAHPQVGEGLLGHVAQTGQPIRVAKVPLNQRDPAFQPEYQDYLEQNRVDSLVIVPLRAQGRLFGILGAMRKQPGQPYTENDQTFLQEIADRTALAIANAQLFNKAQRNLSKLQGLRQIDIAITDSVGLRTSLDTILNQVISQLAVDAASVLILNPHSLTLDFIIGTGFHTNALQGTRLRLGEGYAGQAAMERQVITISDLRYRKTDLLRSPTLMAEGFVSYYAVPLVAKGQVKGVLELFHRGPLTPGSEWVEFLKALAGQTAIAIDNASLFEDLQRSNQQLIMAYDATIEGWSRALDLRDNETEGHTRRVTQTTLSLARAMGISDSELVHIRRGSMLHDIGKMGIPDSILLKPGPLTEAEWEIMRKHPVYAYEMLAPIAYLKPALDIPYCHHEKWDGTGYPRGLKGDQIPIAARIFAIVDVWDALLSDRPYRKAMPEAQVREYLLEQSGLHFDPKVVIAFFQQHGDTATANNLFPMFTSET